jgi:predicted aspartyl protease
MELHDVVIPIRQIRLEKDGLHLMVHAKLGRIKINVLIDTGASRTVFDAHFISNVFPNQALIPLEKPSTGVGSNSIQVSVFHIPAIAFGKLKLTDFQAAIIDLGHVNESYAQLGLEPIHAVLGCDLLQQCGAIINLKMSELHLSKF